MYFLDKRQAARIPGTPAYQQKREEEQKQSEITRINQDLQRVVGRFRTIFDQESERFQHALRLANRHVQSSTILHLSYRNNFESIQVAKATMLFLLGEAANTQDEEVRVQIIRSIQSTKQRLARIAPQDVQEVESLERKIKKP